MRKGAVFITTKQGGLLQWRASELRVGFVGGQQGCCHPTNHGVQLARLVSQVCALVKNEIIKCVHST
jgi:hypothetical protein